MPIRYDALVSSPLPSPPRRRTRSGRLLRSRAGDVLAWLIPLLVVLLSRLVFRTCRITFVDKRHEDRFLAVGRQILFAGLHETMMLLPYHFRDRRGGLVMVSASRDGALIAGTIERFGLCAVRGSSGRRGGEALDEMIAGLRTGRVSGGIIVDGPKGPPLVAKAGAVVIARATGLPIVPGTWWCRPLVCVRSWDRTIVPIPFSRIVFAFEEAMLVPPDTPDDQIEPLRAELTRRLRAARAKAQARLGVAL